MEAQFTPHTAAAIILAILVFYGFAKGRLAVEIISLLTIGVIALGLYFFPLANMSPAQGLALAFEGFGHPALITICALMVMGRGLVVTGALDPAARALRRVWRISHQLGLLVTLILVFAMSMFINDTPVLVLVLPIMVQLAAQGAMPASKTLIPVNSAILIGGMATTIGTSTNLLVVSIAQDLGMPPIAVFSYAPLVLVAALVALPYIWLVMPRLLPDNSPEAGHGARRYVATFRIAADGAAHGKSADDLRAVLPDDFRFDDAGFAGVEAGGRFAVSGARDTLVAAQIALAAEAAPAWLAARIRREAAAIEADVALAEMAISADSRLNGLTLQRSGIEHVAVVGVHQVRGYGTVPRADTAEAPLREGDVLLVMGTEAQLQAFAARDGLLLLDGVKELPRSGKAALALAIMGGAVALASFGLMPIAVSSLGGAVLMFVTGCVKFERVGRALSAQVIVLIAASLAIGKLLLVSGAAGWLGQTLALGLQFLPAAAVLAAIMLFATVLTNFASNASAAAVGTPIAVSLAQQLGLPIEPLVLAVLFGCNFCYATPFAYQTNLLIMGEGDYQFRDYARTGVPLIGIMVVTLSILLVWRYGL